MLPPSSRLFLISAEEDESSLFAAQGFWVILSPFPLGKSFREQQCEKYNSYNFTDLEGNRLEWVPKYAGVSPRDRCKLFCRARGRSEFKVFEPKVRYLPTSVPNVHLYSHFRANSCKSHALSPLSPGDRWDAVWSRDPVHLCARAVHQGWLRPRCWVLQETGQVWGVRRQRLNLQENIRLTQPIQVRHRGEQSLEMGGGGGKQHQAVGREHGDICSS